MDKIRILNIDVLNITRQQLLENLHEGVLITPNLDHLIKLQKDQEFYDCYKKAEWVVCDSNILRLFSKLLKKPFVEAIPGSSFFTSYYMYHKDDADCKIFLLGAKEGVADKAMKKINEKVGRVKVWMALGATIDFEAGNVKRAPKIFQKLAMEWLYRFLMEPKRLFKRYFVDDMKFFWYFGKQLIGVYKDPFASKKASC